MNRLDDLRVVVVGGASGIGRATADLARELGAEVAVLDRTAPADVERIEELNYRRCDATDGTALDRQMRGAVDDLGGLDALIHTAGIHDGFTRLEDYEPDKLRATADTVLHVNVTSALLAVRAALPALHGSEHGSITLTSSESAFGARGGGPLYTASKWAVRGLVDQLSAELAPQLRVNGVAPGGTSGTQLRGPGDATIGGRPGREADLLPTTKLHRRIDAADVATAYTYLISPHLARAITGVIINVDGGRNTV